MWGVGNNPLPMRKLARPIGGQLCPDLPLLEDGSHHIIHLKESHSVLVCSNRSTASLKDRCSVAACVGTVCYKKQLLFAQWNAQRVNGTALVVALPLNIVTSIKPAPACGIKSMTAPSGWDARRCC